MNNREAQFIAKQTMNFIKKKIMPGMKLAQIRKMCEDKMMALGADSFWYWNVGAFVFSGNDTKPRRVFGQIRFAKLHKVMPSLPFLYIISKIHP